MINECANLIFVISSGSCSRGENAVVFSYKKGQAPLPVLLDRNATVGLRIVTQKQRWV
jgi:hypothetical protein